MKGFSKDELRLLRRLSTPGKVQDWLNSIPNNFEKKGETCMSPRRVIREKRAHCIEGALFAAAAFLFHGRSAWVMHFETDRDEDHVIALFKERGLWGAVSKTNHSLMRFRDPVYKSPRELALSYFNEYFMYEDGRKTLRGYTLPFDVKKRFGTGWLTEEKELWNINDALFDARHLPIAPPNIMKKLRRVDPIEIEVTKHTDWKRK